VEGLHKNVRFGIGVHGYGVALVTLVGATIGERIQAREHPPLPYCAQAASHCVAIVVANDITFPSR
jgi:hypothetical protein